MITIAIPVFNQAEFLSAAIESALDQTINCEVIICNDGSTDNSLEVAQRYPVKIINQVNKGLSSARNSLIMNASSEYILFLDADDILKSNAVAVIENNIKNYIYAKNGFWPDIIAGSFKTFGTSNQEIILMPYPTLEDFKSGNRIGYCAAVRKSKLLELGGYSPRMLEGYEDLHLWMNLLTRGARIITIPEVLWFYRTKKESMYTKITPEIHQKLLDQINKDMPLAQLSF